MGRPTVSPRTSLPVGVLHRDANRHRGSPHANSLREAHGARAPADRCVAMAPGVRLPHRSARSSSSRCSRAFWPCVLITAVLIVNAYWSTPAPPRQLRPASAAPLQPAAPLQSQPPEPPSTEDETSPLLRVVQPVPGSGSYTSMTSGNCELSNPSGVSVSVAIEAGIKVTLGPSPGFEVRDFADRPSMLTLMPASASANTNMLMLVLI